MIRRPTASKNLGDDYRDAIGLQYIVEMIRNPAAIEWVSFEDPEAAYFDDVIVKFPDRVEYLQAKYKVDSSTWSLDNLLSRKSSRSRSFLQKWAISWRKVQALGWPYAATIRMRGTPDSGLAQLLHDGFGGFCDVATLKSVSSPEWDKMSQQMEDVGLSVTEIDDFLRDLKMQFHDEDVEVFLEEVRQSFFRLGAGVNEHNWNALLEQLRHWVRYRLPAPDGRIRSLDARSAAQLWDPKQHVLPQKFDLGESVYVLRMGMRASLEAHFQTRQGGLVILQGPPGSGKSSFLTWLQESPPKDSSLSISHFCFTGLEDKFVNARLDAHRSVKGLLATIALKAHSRLTNTENPDHACLAPWLRILAQDALSKGERVYLILDGLDHVVRERDKEEVRNLLRFLPSPIPDGLWVILGTQPLNHLFPPSLERTALHSLDIENFDEMAVEEYLKAHFGQQVEDDLVEAARQLSGGNPLYLHYLCQTLLDKGRLPRPDDLERIPPYQDNIENYYRALWRNPVPGGVNADRGRVAAQALLTIFGWAEFELPVDSLGSLAKYANLDYVDVQNSFENIRNLLDPGRLKDGGIRLYHESLRRFIREQPEAQGMKATALDTLLTWVQTAADAETRWEAEWPLQLQRNNPAPLLEGISREWILDALREQRSHRHLVRLIELGVKAAATAGDVVRMQQIGWWRWYAGDAISDDPNDTFSLQLNALFAQGIPAARITEFLQGSNPYGRSGLLELLPLAWENGADDLIAELQENILKGNREDLPESIRAAAYGNYEPQRILKWYRSNLEKETKPSHFKDPERFWKRVWRSYCRELGNAGLHNDLRELLCSGDLREHEQWPVVDALLGVLVQDLEINEVRKLLRSLTASFITPYAELVGFLVEEPVEGEWSLEKVLETLSGTGKARYGDPGNWDEIYPLLLWKAMVWSLSEEHDHLSALQDALDKHQYASVFSTALVQLGVKLSKTVQAGRTPQLPELVEILSRVDAPRYPSDEVFYAFRVGFNLFLENLGYVFDLTNFMGGEVALSNEEIRLLIKESGIGFTRVLTWLQKDGRRWLDPAACQGVINQFEEICGSLLDSNTDRAALFARLATLAATFGLPERSDTFLRRSCENVLGYGYHKDMALRMAILATKELPHDSYPEAVSDLLELAKIVDVIEHITDRDEQRDLNVELAEALIRHDSPHVFSLTAQRFTERDYDEFDSISARLMVRAGPNDPIAYAMAYTFTDPSERRLAKSFLQTHPRISGPAAETKEQARFHRAMASDDDEEQREGAGTVTLPTPAAPALDAALDSLNRANLAIVEEYVTRNAVALPQLGRQQVGRIANYVLSAWEQDYYVSSDVLNALYPVLHRNRDLNSSFRCVCAAQERDYGWQQYMTSKERQEQRLSFVLRHFPGKLTEYMVKSMEKQTAKFGGILSVARLTQGLVRAGRSGDAHNLVRSFVAFVIELCRDLPLSSPQWSQTSTTPRDLLDIAFMRFGHVEIAARTLTAKSLSHEFEHYPSLVERLIAYIEGEQFETRRLDAWLCLSLIAETDPQAIAPFMERLTVLEAQSTLAASIVYHDLCDAVGIQKQKPVHRAPSAAIRVPAVEITDQHHEAFAKLLSTWPSMERKVTELAKFSSTARDDILAFCVQWGMNNRVVEDSNDQLRRASDSVYRRYQGVVQPLAWDMLRSAYYVVATNAFWNGSLGQKFAFEIARLHEVNSSLSRLSMSSRPEWYPIPVFREEGYGSLYNWHSELENAVDNYIEQEGDTLFGLYMADMKPDGSEAWSTFGMAFYYVSDGELPEPREVWDYLKSFDTVNRAVTTRPFAHPHDWLVLNEEIPGFIGDFVIFPVVGEIAWHGGHHDAPFHLLEAVGLLPSTPICPELAVTGADYISFSTGGQEIAQGHYWGSDAVTRMYANKAGSLTGGYILSACEPLGNLIHNGVTLRLGFVRRSVFSTFVPTRGKEEKIMEEYKFHGVSSLII